MSSVGIIRYCQILSDMWYQISDIQGAGVWLLGKTTILSYTVLNTKDKVEDLILISSPNKLAQLYYYSSILGVPQLNDEWGGDSQNRRPGVSHWLCTNTTRYQGGPGERFGISLQYVSHWNMGARSKGSRWKGYQKADWLFQLQGPTLSDWDESKQESAGQ